MLDEVCVDRTHYLQISCLKLTSVWRSPNWAKTPFCFFYLENKTRTYNNKYSPVVTNPTTDLSIWSLCLAERTGCPILFILWSYVAVLMLRREYIWRISSGDWYIMWIKSVVGGCGAQLGEWGCRELWGIARQRRTGNKKYSWRIRNGRILRQTLGGFYHDWFRNVIRKLQKCSGILY